MGASGASMPAVWWDVWRWPQRSSAERAVVQRQRLAALVRYAYDHAPYYRALYRRLPPELSTDASALQALPLVTKPELMAHFDEAMTDSTLTRIAAEAFMATTPSGSKLYRGRYFLCRTSGTTGRPGLFAHDAAAMRVYGALLLARTLPARVGMSEVAGLVRAGVRVALAVTPESYSIEAVLTGYFASRYTRLTKGHIRLFSVMRPLPELVRELNSFRPTILAGYATALDWLAQQQDDGLLRISPRAIVTTSEWLRPSARSRVAHSFHCPVRDLYAATEFLSIAAECAHGALHVNSDWVILEPVDADGRPVPPNHPSQSVLLTNLANRVQPLIRYDLGDSVTELSERCPCGSPLPAIRVEGRREDLLRFQSAEGSEVSVLPLALTSVVSAIPGVERYQLVQSAPNMVEARFDAAANATRADVGAEIERRLRSFFDGQGLPNVRIGQAAERPHRDERSGKYRTVLSQVNADTPEN